MSFLFRSLWINCPRNGREFARTLGLALAMVMRIGLLCSRWTRLSPLSHGRRDSSDHRCSRDFGRTADRFCRTYGRFVSAHPSIKMLALSFLVVIGVVLIADGFDHHVPKGYIYFSLAFAVCVEILNIGKRKICIPKRVG
jgi:predicted tellurium resistance membrane protein TerC